jgi:exonuclease SbcC
MAEARAAAATRRAEAHRLAGEELARATAAAAAAPGLRDEAARLAAEEVSLAALAGLAGELVSASSALVELQGEVEQAVRRAAALDAALVAGERELVELERRLVEAQNAALEEAALVVQVDRAQQAARARAALALEEVASAQLAAGAVALEEERARVAARRAAAAEELEGERARREQGLAAELAMHLVDGAPCPVCGSSEHPAPAAGAGAGAADATREAIRRAAEEIASLDGELTTLDRRAAEDGAGARGHAARAGELRELLGDDAGRSAEELVAAARALAEKVRAARRAMGQRTGLAGARDRTQEQLARLRGERALAGEAQVVAERTLAVARARIDDMRARIASGARDLEERDAQRLAAAIGARLTQVARGRARALENAGTLEAKLGRARETAAAEARLADEARRQSDEARLAAAEAQAELARLVRAAGLADAAELRRGLADVPRRERARLDIEAWEAARVATAARLEALDAELGDAARPDVAALASAAAAAEEEAGRLATEVGTLRAALVEGERARERAGELAAELDDLQARLATFAHVARVAAGDNPMRMSLARFVLAQRIDEVAVAASERLLRLSRGRYLLRRSDDVRHAARGSGLELVVEDRMTGVDRSVQTLSNGEQFLASLSLAMGLADTVQAHAGGVRLDSLFIDEGFGSLDDEALDLVIRVLEDLRAGGRLVGIITHVAELRERLTTRISVRKGPRGSTTQMVV